MAFAVTAFKTYSVAAFEAVTAQFEQVAEFTITRGASDIDLDIGDVAGTFWADADGTALGLEVLGYWKSILGKARNILSIHAPQITNALAQSYDGTPATGQYEVVSTTPAALAFLFFATDAAPATITLTVRFSLKAGELPVKNYGV
jgi:hypothetical protein